MAYQTGEVRYRDGEGLRHNPHAHHRHSFYSLRLQQAIHYAS